MKKKFIGILFALVFALMLPTMAMAEGNEAKIGDTEYATLSAAVGDASDGDEIDLLQDVIIEKLTINKSVTIDLNGYTMKLKEGSGVSNIWNSGADILFTCSEGKGTICFDNVSDGGNGYIFHLASGSTKFKNINFTAKNISNAYAAVHIGGAVEFNNCDIYIENSTGQRVFGGSAKNKLIFRNCETVELKNVSEGIGIADVIIENSNVHIYNEDSFEGTGTGLFCVFGEIIDSEVIVEGFDLGFSNGYYGGKTLTLTTTEGSETKTVLSVSNSNTADVDLKLKEGATEMATFVVNENATLKVESWILEGDATTKDVVKTTIAYGNGDTVTINDYVKTNEDGNLVIPEGTELNIGVETYTIVSGNVIVEDVELVVPENTVLSDGEGNEIEFPNGGTINPDGTVDVVKNESDGGTPVYSTSDALKDYENGEVSANFANPSAGVLVTLTVTPDDGYEVGEITITDENGKEIEVIDNGDGTYSYRQPESEIEIDVEFNEIEKEEEKEDKPEEKPEEEPKAEIILTIGSPNAIVNGEILTNDVAPIIRNGRTMLPIRFIVEELGGKIEWNNELKKVTITKGDLVIEIFIGSPFALVNGKAVELDSPAFIENGRTYLPVRFVADYLGADVKWIDETKTVIITEK